MGLPNEEARDLEPRRPGLVALAVYLVAALTLCWPILQGKFLAGPSSDQFEAGYSFRHFAAEYFRAHGSIPQWNPYLFGGMPFVGAASGDIFYPTAILRWFLPTDVAMNLGFAVHIVLAGLAMYGLLRTVRTSWAGAVTGGLVYQLTGIVISMVHPGHDGKLFVSALAPFLFTGVIWAIRDRRWAGYGIMALATGLSLQAHPQASQYLLIAAAIWGALWVFGTEGPKGPDRWRSIGLAMVAVALGVGLYAVYALPMLEYVPFSPRGDGGYNSGWEHAIQYGLPANELVGTLLPKIYGGPDGGYFGQNGARLHSEYLGPLAILLAIAGLRGNDRKTSRWAMGVIAIIFLLVSLGGDTPFYRLWFELVPMAKRLRAPGMAFFLVAMSVAFFAGLGAERVFRAAGSVRRITIAGTLLAGLGLLGAIGALQLVSDNIARNPGFEGFAERAIANAPELKADGLRLLIVTAGGLGVLLLVAKRRVAGVGALAAVLGVVWADAWLVGRGAFEFSPGASVAFASDSVMAKLQATPKPYRVFGPAGQVGGLNPYPKSWLMAAGIPTVFGYHGNELVAYDDLLGGKSAWKNQLSPSLWKMLAVRYIVLSQPQQLPGFHLVLGPATTYFGPAYLFEADTIPPYARVMAGAAKVPDAQLAATAADPRFPVDRLAVYSDTASVSPAPLNGQIPEPSLISATVTEWEPGRLKVALQGSAPAPEYLVVAENWYPDWQATIDGKPAPVLRAQNTLLSVAVPAGAKEVAFVFSSAAYAKGRMISLGSLAGVLVLFGMPLFGRTKGARG